MFRRVSLYITRSFSLYTQQWYMSYNFVDSLRVGSICSILILLASCHQICMTYNIAVCTVKNSWWWTEELSEIRIELGSTLILLASCQQTCMTYTIAVCTVKNSWWWTEELFEIRMELGSILILFASCQQTCMTHTIAVCTVNNSWWWTEELSETRSFIPK